MSLAAGDRLGLYEVVALLGAGGMGEVYRARDTKLGREVAIKVLPAAVAQDPERLARFKREAQLLAALNHPNIAAIYGLEEAGATPFLVLELIEGEDLAQRLKSGPLPVAEAHAIARQIAEALEAAHEKGIVHRDLKPANVQLTPEGKVKVVDFGLAKAYAGDSSSGNSLDSAHSPTLTHAATMAGVILGTAAYMSPEQARAKSVDKRADIWSFGVVLHEMLTGSPLFHGETVSDTLAAVLTREFDPAALPAATPPATRRLLRRCLERNPKNRLHDIADARIVLDDLASGRIDFDEPALSTHQRVVARPSSWFVKLAWLGAGFVLGALTIASLGRSLLAPAPTRPPSVRSLTYSGTSGDASPSADGKNVAFVSARDGRERIWLKQLASGEEVALTAGEDFAPRISPDSSTVLFLRRTGDAADLYLVPLFGGEARRLAPRAAFPNWSPDGKKIVFARHLDQKSRLIQIPAEGGEERVLLERDLDIGGLAWSPDGARLLVREASRVNANSLRMLGIVGLPSGAYRPLIQLPAGSRSSDVCWDGDDALLMAWSPSMAARSEALLQRLPLGASRWQTLFSFNSLPSRIELAGAGSLVFDGVSEHLNLFEVSAGGAPERALTGGPTIDRQPAFSPDGRRIVFSSDRSGSLDLWSLELATGSLRRLTFDAADDWDPQWSPNGKHLLWSSNRSGHFEVWIAETDGTGARQLTSDGVDAENPTMTRDGTWVVYSSSNPKGQGVWKIRPDGREAKPILLGTYSLPELSPVVDWLAVVNTTDETSRVQVVRLEDGAPIATLRIPGRDRNTGRSRWMPDGRTLVSWGQSDAGEWVLSRQPIAAGRDTSSQREIIATSSGERRVESFGISPIDGQIVVSAGGFEADVMLAEGIPGIGASLP